MTYVAPNPIRFEALAAKLETTYGTDPVPTAAANGVRLSDRVFSGLIPSAEWPNLRDDVMNQSLIPLAAAAAHGQKAQIDIAWELKGLGSDYTSAAVFVDADPLIQCCGWAGTWSAAPDKWTYAPILTGARPSCTIYGWGGLNLYKVSGCRGNFMVTIKAGQLIQVRFRLEGILTALPAAAAAPVETFTGGVPPAAVSQVTTIGPWNPDYDEIVIESGNDAVWLYSGNAVDGLQSYDYGISKPGVKVTARQTSQTTYDPFTDWTTPTARAFSSTFGTVAFNKGTFSDSALWIPSQPRHQNQKNFTGWEVNYRCTAPQLLLN